MHPKHTSCVMLAVGLFGLLSTDNLLGGTVITGCGITSIVFHRCYTPWTKRIDLTWNCMSILVLLYFRYRWYYWLSIMPMFIGTCVVSRRTRGIGAAGAPGLHTLYVHVPGIIGQLCVVLLP